MFSKTPDIIPFSSPHKMEVLSPSELQKIQNGTLHLLSEVGVYFPSEKALKIFADHGAIVNWETKIVRIQPDLVKKAMSTAPRSFVMGGREKRFDLTLDGTHSYLSTDGCGVYVIDLETRQKRPSRKADVAMMARVSDALPLISFFWPLVSAQDHGITAPLHECHAGLTNTLKHVRGGTTVHPKLAKSIVEMATVVAGSEAERRLRPPINANICTIAPLAHDSHGIETALVYAEAGIPTSFMAMPTMGSTAPASILGAIVLGDAEVISGMVLLQLAYPGAPVFHSIIPSLMDPRSGGYIGSVPISPAAKVQLAHAWNVPSLGGGSTSSDAKDVGWESGTDGGFGSAMIALSGGEVCGYLGMLGSSMILYPEQIILEHEICLHAYEIFKSYEFNEQDMALDVIAKVGPRGHYLREKHTRKHIRDFRYSPFLWSTDEHGKQRPPRDVALEKFKMIYETHHPEPLPDKVLNELNQILAAADRTANSLES
ncbi:MAG: trimethylamine methyltransferase family protein [Anaerolineales bacterium]